MVDLKNTLADSDASSTAAKRIKLEPGGDDDALLLSIPSGQHGRRGRKGKSSSEDRALELLKDPRLSAVEPGQVLCRMCGNWIKLFKHTDYSAANWRVHADKCEIRSKWKLRLKEDPDSAYDLLLPEEQPQPELILKENSEAVREVPPPFLTPFSKPLAKSCERRKRQLLDDDRCKIVEPNRVLCAVCNEWVKLHHTYPYEKNNWIEHVALCRKPRKVRLRDFFRFSSSTSSENHENRGLIVDDTPAIRGGPAGSRPSTLRSVKSAPALRTKPEPQEDISESAINPADSEPPQRRRKGRTQSERRRALEADSRCTNVQAHQVYCLLCDKWVKLYKEVPFVDSNWTRHIARCETRANAPPTSNTVASAPITSVKLIIMRKPVKSKTSITTEERERKAVEKRKKELMDDDRITEVAPQEVRCRLCQSWIALSQTKQYDSKSWLQHIQACERTTRLRSREGKPKTSLLHLHSVSKAPEDEGKSLNANEVVESNSINEMINHAEEDRRQKLLMDGRCRQVGPFQLFCKQCCSYLPAYEKEKYSVAFWESHIDNCTGRASSLSSLGDDDDDDDDDDEEFDSSKPRPPSSDGNDRPQPMNTRGTSEEAVTGPEERRRRLLNDSRIGAAEPDRVFCKICERWLKLSNEFDYATFNWYKHVKRCEDRKRSMESRSEPASAQLGTITVEEDVLEATPTKKRLNVHERYNLLKGDTRIKEMEPHRVQCGICDRWIKLQVRTEYDAHNWIAHIGKCQTKVPRVDQDGDIGFLDNPGTQEQVALAKTNDRFSQLQKDSRISSIEPHRVLCGFCQQWIKLRDDAAYVPYNWFKHAGSCERKHSTPSAHPEISQVEEEPAIKAPSIGPERTADQRREAKLRADPRAAAVEKGRVHCRMCDSWIRLNSSTSFLPGNWIRHATRCQRKMNWTGEVPVASPERAATADLIDLSSPEDNEPMGNFGYVELGELLDAFEPVYTSTSFAVKAVEALQAADKASKKHGQSSKFSSEFIAGSTSRMSGLAYTNKRHLSESSKRTNRSEEERKADLEADPRTRTVEKERILCNMCGKWIQMRHDVSYSPQNWLKHADICEVRSGWTKGKGKERATSTGSDPADLSMDVDNTEDDFDDHPYTAKIADAQSPKTLDTPTNFKPVDWNSVPFVEDGSDSSNEDNGSLSRDYDMDVERDTSMDAMQVHA